MTLAKKLLMKPKPGSVSNAYVEFVSSTAMTITPNYTNTGITLQYSLDKVTWNNITAKAVTPSANVIYFRGSATGTKSLFTANNTANAWIFTGATNLEVIGNINMLIQDILGGEASDVPLAIYSYSNMFYGCTSLVVAPALPATTLATYCYNSMFYNCTSLVTAPALPATTLTSYCYNSMFRGCNSLTTAPALPATTLASYCYNVMFYGCKKLTTAPSLPATTLADYCYNSMFLGCTSLTTLPKLPTLALQIGCYYKMFYGCTKIKLSTTLIGIYYTAYKIPTTGTGTTATDALTDMFTGTGGTFTGTPSINTTYYTENTPV